MHAFEWDAAKAASNLVKHGVSFEDAADALCGLTLTRSSGRGAEMRFQSLCICAGRMIVVVWTLRGSVVRLISARRAKQNEREQFGAALTRATEAR